MISCLGRAELTKQVEKKYKKRKRMERVGFEEYRYSSPPPPIATVSLDKR